MKRKNGEKSKQGFENLMYQLLETELGGVQVYRTALSCAVNEELRGEWEEYLTQTENHVKIARRLLQDLGLDPDADTPARQVVRHIGESLIETMQMAKKGDDPDAAQIVAAECVVEAETKDHLNWELLGMVAEKTKGEAGKAMKQAYKEVEKEEDHHLYHTTGWTRELWLEALGLPAVLPPPEEEKNVETAIGAARAKQSRRDLL
jgi:hypothetical protein